MNSATQARIFVNNNMNGKIAAGFATIGIGAALAVKALEKLREAGPIDADEIVEVEVNENGTSKNDPVMVPIKPKRTRVTRPQKATSNGRLDEDPQG